MKSSFSNSSLSNIYTSGGGLIEEGEIVEVVEIPRDGIESFTFDETKPKPPGCMLACMWWLNNHSHLDKWLSEYLDLKVDLSEIIFNVFGVS